MRSFWNDRAREDALYFVDNRLVYGDADETAFWAGGEEGLDQLLAIFGARIQRSDVVVDVGCGVGRFTRALAARASKVMAIDISEEMLAQAQELNAHLDNVEWVLGDGKSLAGIPDGVADACISHVVFQHIPDPEITLGYIEEIGRVLKPKGWALIQVSNDPDVHRRRRSITQRLRSLTGRAPKGQEHPAWLGSAVDIGDVRAATDRGGMDLERVWGAGTQFCELLLRRPAS
jgi:SAM-dependent methyltransferase